MSRASRFVSLLLLAAGLVACVPTVKPPDYAKHVWPAPPDKPRIQLEDVIFGRLDVLAKTGGLQRALLGDAPGNPLDQLKKPIAVEFDAKGRLLVTDWGLGVLFRFSRAARSAEVFGTRGSVTLKNPMGLDLGPDGTVYVADVGLKQVVAFDLSAEGKVAAVIGKPGELDNPTDVAVSPDGARLYVTDSKAHRIVAFDARTGARLSAFGKAGERPGEFAYPSALCFDGQGNLVVVDQINARIQIVTTEGEPIDAIGARGVGFGDFTRPKDVAVDEVGFLYATDAAFNNVQIFDADYKLLTFVGAGGREAGQFTLASGVAVQGDRFAVVDQLTPRVQVFRFVVPKSSE